jgi:hypothetical protein
MVRDATATAGVVMKGAATDGIAPASRATEGPAKVGMLTDGLAIARRSPRDLAPKGLVASRTLRQTTDRSSVPRIAPANLMGYKA